ncbi:hypothetical protein [Acetivibrio sp. MSJd-27]|uniref:hypothetical protein n=1 Tax=Acetivibrio sp. MSJd-27 TaxID=2841523 RepID=UPI001C11D6C6|nr:hypothetical protein [Acetivibrio sp. MSJd-27]MBU5451007.1 hypothetical protein [Acetivibrio sp. MSJd-27]
MYRLLFLMPAEGGGNNALSAMKHSGELIYPTIMKFYNMKKECAERYFRDMWLVAHSLATLAVTAGCPYSDDELQKIMAGFSLSLLKAMKEIDGFAENTYDKKGVFETLNHKQV